MDFLDTDRICEELTQKGIPWNKLQDGRVIVWTEGGLVDRDRMATVYLLLRHKLYVVDQYYNEKLNLTTTTYERKL